MYETKLNKDFDWHKAFHKVLGTDDNDALDKVLLVCTYVIVTFSGSYIEYN